MNSVKLFSGKEYNLKHDWKNDRVQAEDGKSSLCKGHAFIEIFYDDFYIRGDGASIEEAEINAWEKYTKYLNCNDNHDYERKNDSGLGHCRTCGIKTTKLPNIAKCTCCNKIGAVFYIGSKLHCFEHFMEKAKKLTPTNNNKNVIKKYITIEFLFNIEEINENSKDEEINKSVENLIQYGEKSLFDFCTDEINKVLCIDELKDFDSSCDLFDDLSMNKASLFIILLEMKKTRYGKLNSSKKLNELFVSNADKYDLKIR